MLRLILARLFWIPYCRYVDDKFGADVVPLGEQRHEGGDSPCQVARIACVVLRDLLGWELDGNKRVASASSVTVLGVFVEFLEQLQSLQFTVPPEKLKKWLDAVRGILARGHVSPAEAGRLAGALSWAASIIFGKGRRLLSKSVFPAV